MSWKSTEARNITIRSMRESGHTLREIQEATGASKSVISYHINRVSVKDEERLRARLLRSKTSNTANLVRATESARNKWNAAKQEVQDEATLEWASMKLNPEFLGFLGLYWGEGNKASSEVGVINNDPGIILASVRQFLTFDPGAVLRISVRINPDQDGKSCKDFWESCLGRSVETVPKGWIGKKKQSRSPYGICCVRYSSWKTRQKILTWIDCWRREIGVPSHMG